MSGCPGMNRGLHISQGCHLLCKAWQRSPAQAHYAQCPSRAAATRACLWVSAGPKAPLLPQRTGRQAFLESPPLLVLAVAQHIGARLQHTVFGTGQARGRETAPGRSAACARLCLLEAAGWLAHAGHAGQAGHACQPQHACTCMHPTRHSVMQLVNRAATSAWCHSAHLPGRGVLVLVKRLEAGRLQPVAILIKLGRLQGGVETGLFGTISAQNNMSCKAFRTLTGPGQASTSFLQRRRQRRPIWVDGSQPKAGAPAAAAGRPPRGLPGPAGRATPAGPPSAGMQGASQQRGCWPTTGTAPESAWSGCCTREAVPRQPPEHRHNAHNAHSRRAPTCCRLSAGMSSSSAPPAPAAAAAAAAISACSPPPAGRTPPAPGAAGPPCPNRALAPPAPKPPSAPPAAAPPPPPPCSWSRRAYRCCRSVPSGLFTMTLHTRRHGQAGERG